MYNKTKLLKNHNKMMEIGRPFMVERYGEVIADQVVADSLIEYEKLIPQLPDIGGKDNDLTDTLVQTARALALYRVMSKRGETAVSISNLVRNITQAWINRYPKITRNLIGRFYLSGMWQKQKRKKAAVSQTRQYPQDFVYEFVEGDGENFEWGINYTECGVVKFFHEQGADEFTPYMCELDYLMFPALGIELKRTGTIAQGCSHCDFRFSKKGT